MDRNGLPRQSGQHGLLMRLLVVVGLAVVLVGVLFAMLARTGGIFIYSLDDPYIHLTLARNIAQGHYGLNLSEASSPSSSALWPLLLLPWLHELAPLVICALCAVATAWIVSRYAPFKWTIFFLVLTNAVGLVFTGMEHSLQVLLATVAALGLYEHATTGRIPKWWLAALVLQPLIRYENLLITLPVAGYLWSSGEKRTGALVAALSILPLILFSLFLKSLGLGFLPNSILAKDAAGTGNPAMTVLKNLYHNFKDHPLEAGSFVLLLGISAVGAKWSKYRKVALTVLAAGVLHLVFGRFGWMARYECYMVAFALVGAWTVWQGVEKEKTRAEAAIATAVILAPAAVFYIAAAAEIPHLSRKIYLQQYQMARLVEELGEPVAVNDIGIVSWRSKSYVLDLWGLASKEALVGRRSPDPQWMDDLAQAHGARLVMIYPNWFYAIPARWQRIGTLRRGNEAGDDVAVFAASDAEDLQGKLEAFAPKLPAGASYVSQ